MSTYQEHVDSARDALTEADLNKVASNRAELLAKAQVHATLALAAATAGEGCLSCDEFHLDGGKR